MVDIVIPEHLKFPRTLNKNTWSQYVNRQLTWTEICIIEEVKAEKYINVHLQQLYDHCEKQNLYVPLLTELDGNCLFESLVYYNISNSTEELRKSLAYLMFVFKDCKNFLPGVDVTLKEMFSFTNDIELVKTINDEEVTFYNYTYDVMCKDLSNVCSWSKLPTEIIMRVMSYLFNLDFHILHNENGHITNVNVYSDLPDEKRPKLKKILLGLIGESHYVPIDILNSNETIDAIYYHESKQHFLKWGYTIENIKIKQYEDQLKRIKNHKRNNFSNMNEQTFNTLNNNTNNESTVDFNDC
jgi:hypothetical protein